MDYETRTQEKFVEVALPLDDINAASAREKSIRHGHPSMLHLWWATSRTVCERERWAHRQRELPDAEVPVARISTS